MPSFTPHNFGKYFLVDKIATGGMAEIFKAKTYSHGGFENLLVIKRILPHIGEKEEFVEMFIDEAKVTVALQHPNIVRIYDFGKIFENYFIAMECVEGKDARNVLKKLARRRQFLPARFGAIVALEVCKGLQYAHDKCDRTGEPYGIVHRDISPSNIIISYDGDVKIADFGIAQAESNAYHTKDGVLKGKYEYMSPEQAEGKSLDYRSDLFSLGIVLYEMLTGRRLFKTESELATLKKIRTGDFPPPGELKSDIPPALEAVVMRALSLNVEDRYGSAEEMAEELRQFLFPSNPDALRRELAGFMTDLFAEEIEEERLRLEHGSLVAMEIKDSMPEGWDGTTNSTMTSATQTAVRALPFVAGGAIGGLLLLLLVGGGVGWWVWSHVQEDPGASEELVQVGSMGVTVSPAAEIFLDGESRGVSKALSVADLEPGEYLLRLEAEGFEPAERTVHVRAGERSKVAVSLTPIPVKEPAKPQPQVSSGEDKPSEGSSSSNKSPEVSFRSTPPGAVVFVEGARVGTTPFTWRAGSAGEQYTVRMELDGFETASGTVSGLANGERTPYGLTLKEVAKAGKLTVLLAGGGWAYVYVDGQKLDKTAPLRNLELAAGSHEVRVVNEALGVEHTETVTVSGGATVTVKAAPE